MVAIAVLSGTLVAQVPRTEGKSLSQKPVVVADAIKGRAALLIVTFSKSAGEKATAWTKTLQAKGVNDKSAIYQVAQLEDVPRFFRKLAISGMRKGIPVSYYDTFVILISDTQLWKDFVSFIREDDPYLVLVDALGQVRHKLSGEMNDERLKQITEKLK